MPPSRAAARRCRWCRPGRSFGCLHFLLLWRLGALARFSLGRADELTGEVDQRLAGEEHRDRRDNAGRGVRTRANRIDGILGEVGAFLLRALPCVLGESPRAKPDLQLVRRGHDARAAALGLYSRRGDFRGVGHSARLSRSTPYHAIPPAIAAKISIPTIPPSNGPMRSASARTMPNASALIAAMAMNSAATSSPA